jgi:hypothetical protein
MSAEFLGLPIPQVNCLSYVVAQHTGETEVFCNAPNLLTLLQPCNQAVATAVALVSWRDGESYWWHAAVVEDASARIVSHRPGWDTEVEPFIPLRIAFQTYQIDHPQAEIQFFNLK